jgi:DNA-binding NtrC family response regulator/PAS domain-containing protein
MNLGRVLVINKSETGVALTPENPDDVFERFVTSKRDGNLGTSIEPSRKAERIADVPAAQLQATLNMIPASTWYAAPSGGLTFVNERCADYFGLPKDHPLRFGAGTCAAWESQIPVLHPDDQEETRRVWSECLSASRYCEVSFRVRDAHGNYRWCLSRMEPLRGNDGTLLHWVGINLDIEERQQDLAKALRKTGERLQQENVALREEIDTASMFEEIVGASPALTTVLSHVSKVARTDSTVLITGETGTGKELVARAIHRRSRRASRAFVAVNCAAIPRDLIASELFGHEKGAFTGAVQRRLGRFELADGGTIFLDEVGELSSETQVALLRVLQEYQFERLGGRDRIQVDVRVIAATNRDLTAAVADGTFREDLFYRLNVFPLEMPPLRERQEDIPVLMEYFIGRYARKAGKTFGRVSKRTLDHLQSYLWPGNVRELQNIIERSVIVSDTDEFTVDESWLSAAPRIDRRLGLSGALAAHEKAIVEEALRASGGRVFGPSGAAARLGIPRSTLEWKIRALKINKSRFRVRAPLRS